MSPLCKSPPYHPSTIKNRMYISRVMMCRSSQPILEGRLPLPRERGWIFRCRPLVFPGPRGVASFKRKGPGRERKGEEHPVVLRAHAEGNPLKCGVFSGAKDPDVSIGRSRSPATSPPSLQVLGLGMKYGKEPLERVSEVGLVQKTFQNWSICGENGLWEQFSFDGPKKQWLGGFQGKLFHRSSSSSCFFVKT